jgi:hypothetical protein
MGFYQLLLSRQEGFAKEIPSPHISFYCALKDFLAYCEQLDRCTCPGECEWASMLHGSHIFYLQMTALFSRKPPKEGLNDCRTFWMYIAEGRDNWLIETSQRSFLALIVMMLASKR